MIFSIASLVIFLIYADVILDCIRGNFKKEPNYTTIRQNTMVSVVVPFRNEERNLDSLCKALMNQSYQKEMLEFLFVNDHSEDEGVRVINKSFQEKNFNYRVIELDACYGKKSAIQSAIKESKGDLILTTDADCIMSSNWVSGMVNFQLSTKSSFILGPVTMNRGKSWFKMFQEIEFASLMACTSGTSAAGKPILSNGANLCFTKELFLELNPYKGNLRIPSGDDIFFLQAVKNSNQEYNIQFNSDPEVVVSTEVNDTLSRFISQRIRWAKKVKYFHDSDSTFFGVFVSGMNLLIIMQLFLVLFDHKYFSLFLGTFTIKYLLDTVLLYSANKYLKLKHVLLKALLLSLIYPFYFICIALLSLTTNPQWKGRKASI